MTKPPAFSHFFLFFVSEDDDDDVLPTGILQTAWAGDHHSNLRAGSNLLFFCTEMT